MQEAPLRGHVHSEECEEGHADEAGRSDHRPRYVDTNPRTGNDTRYRAVRHFRFGSSDEFSKKISGAKAGSAAMSGPTATRGAAGRRRGGPGGAGGGRRGGKGEAEAGERTAEGAQEVRAHPPEEPMQGLWGRWHLRV
jgi:hypothetical protein